jgi:hypothetical protein
MAPATYNASAAAPSQLPTTAASTSAGVNPSLAGVDPALVRQLLNENDSLYRENDGLHMQMAELRRQLAAAADEAQKLPAQKQQAQKPQTRSSPQAAPSKTASISPRKVTLAPARPPPPNPAQRSSGTLPHRRSVTCPGSGSPQAVLGCDHPAGVSMK